MILIPLLSLFAIAASQTQDQSLYVRLGSVFESICLSRAENTHRVPRQALPGKVGPVGAKGESGVRGSKGEPGEVNYDRVDEMISTKIQEDLEFLASNLSILSNKLVEANERIQLLKNESKQLRHEAENRTEYCPIKFDGKCFWFEHRRTNTIIFEQGREICAAQGGRPADIYSEDHFYMMLGYLAMFSSRDGWSQGWTGMTYDSQTKLTLLSDGTRAPFLKWHPGHPSGCCNVYLQARATWNDKNQYLAITASSNRVAGVICEK